MLENIASERAVLAGLAHYGLDCYLEIEAILDENTFTVDYNKILYKCISHLFKTTDKVDFVSILSAGSSLGLSEHMNKPDVIKHIHGITETPVQLSTVKGHAQRIRRLQFARHMQGSIKESYSQLSSITGDETISSILSVVEGPIQSASLIYTKQDDYRPKLVGEDIDAYIEHLMNDEKESIGISTGFQSYDEAIGGGLRRKCIDMIAARSKAQPLTSLILTTSGWKKMGEIQIGDSVCQPCGSVSKVTNILNKSHKDVYRFKFSDGSTAEACADHLWKIKASAEKESYQVLSLNDLKSLNIDPIGLEVPTVVSCSFKNNTRQLIHPYDLGIILSESQIVSNKIEIDEYLLADIDKRKSLFSGIVGSENTETIHYETRSPSLKDLLYFLGGSIGYTVIVSYNNTYKLDFHRNYKKTITSIQYCGHKDVQCITIENEDGLYITDGFNVTHNCGKSILGQVIATKVASSGIPVLILDTEMSGEEQRNRMLANISGVPINDIASGRFKRNSVSMQSVKDAADQMKNIKCKHINITGKPFDEVLAIARRWILKDVGFTNGRTNDCLIVYDYLKLTSSDGISNAMQEYQLLGFQMIQLHNFVVEHDCSCLSFVQLNRDGITKETIDTIAGSDRLVWVATSISLFKDKSAEEIADDGPEMGNKKLVPLVARHGPGASDDGYICMRMHGNLARIQEIGNVRTNRRDFPNRRPEEQVEDEG